MEETEEGPYQLKISKHDSQKLDSMILKMENDPLTTEELELQRITLRALPDSQRDKFTQLDILSVVRSRAFLRTFKEREQDVIVTAQTMATLRQNNDYYNLLRHQLENAEEYYHHWWPAYVYGRDQHHHVLYGWQMASVDQERLWKLDFDHLLKLVLQQVTTLSFYRAETQVREQTFRRYFTMIVNLKGLSLRAFMGKEGKNIHTILSMLNDFFPDSLYKVYGLNASVGFRMIHKLVKPWIDPITYQKN